VLVETEASVHPPNLNNISRSERVLVAIKQMHVIEIIASDSNDDDAVIRPCDEEKRAGRCT
jgi:hypothetical protein